LAPFTVLDTSPFTSFADLTTAPALTTITNDEGSRNATYSPCPPLVGVAG
jgi:hypothetical protein